MHQLFQKIFIQHSYNLIMKIDEMSVKMQEHESMNSSSK